LNGKSLNGVSLNGKSLNGRSLNGVSIDGSELIAVDAAGQTVSGAGVAGLVLAGQVSDGSEVDLRVDAVGTLDGSFDYAVSYDTGAGFEPLCGVEADGSPVMAFALAGRWDYSSGTPTGGAWIDDDASFTFACRHAALAKCVELGYAPWEGLREFHQSCTRMLRADYCGDGTAWTVDGTPIDVSDLLGIQTSATTWPIEAEWVPRGATCMTSEGRSRFHLIHGREPPACVTATTRCGRDPGRPHSGLLTDRYDPTWQQPVHDGGTP
jgi:hypothetical protein